MTLANSQDQHLGISVSHGASPFDPILITIEEYPSAGHRPSLARIYLCRANNYAPARRQITPVCGASDERGLIEIRLSRSVVLTIRITDLFGDVKRNVMGIRVDLPLNLGVRRIYCV